MTKSLDGESGGPLAGSPSSYPKAIA